MLEFNRSQAEQIAAKTGDSEGIPNVAEEGAYQVWADGLAERAQSVHDPDLATRRHAVRQPASEFVSKFPVLRAQSQSRAPGAPAPPGYTRWRCLNSQITETLAKLSDACPT